MNEALKRKVEDLQDKINDLALDFCIAVEELATEAYDAGFKEGEEAVGDE